MNVLLSLLSGTSGASKVTLVLAVAVASFLAVAGGWATAMFETIDRLAARLPL